MKPQYMNETRGCVMDLENVIETLKAMDSTIRAKQLEIEYLSQQNLELQRRLSHGGGGYTGTDHPITPPAPSDAMTESERVTYDAWEKSISRPLPVDVDYYNWFNGAE